MAVEVELMGVPILAVEAQQRDHPRDIAVVGRDRAAVTQPA